MQRAKHDHSTRIKEKFRLWHQKKLIRTLAQVGVMFGMPFFGIYGTFVATKRIQLDHIKIPMSGKGSRIKDLRIAQISDLHYGPTNANEKFFDDAIRIIHSQKPHLIVLTGDYYQWDPDYIEKLPHILSQLSAPLGVFGVLGNHDYGACYPGRQGSDPFDFELIKKCFLKNDIRILTNEAIQMNFFKQKFNLVGLHDLWSGLFDPDHSFAKIEEDLPTIVLAHNPDCAALIKQPYDLMLSGHAHGGQVNFPVIGPLAVPVENRQLRRGLHQLDKRRKIYINRGLGYNFRLRIGSPPEVTLIELV